MREKREIQLKQRSISISFSAMLSRGYLRLLIVFEVCITTTVLLLIKNAYNGRSPTTQSISSSHLHADDILTARERLFCFV